MALHVFILHLVFAAFIGGISSLLTAILIRRLRVFDIPNERSSHSMPTPRGGGLAIVIGFLLGVSLIQIIGTAVPLRSQYFFGFLFSLILIASVSFYDDIQHRGIKVKLVTQLVSILIVMAAGNVIDVVRLPWLGEVHAFIVLYPLTLVWLLGLTNAYNFMDGLDGMAASTAAVACGFFSYIAFREGSHFAYLVSLALGAATLGFLVFNWSPAKIFMGDVGSTFLGFAFATLAIVAARYDHGHTSLFVMPLLLFHFIFDSIFTLIRRLRNGDNVFQAHRTHLYQLINRLGYSHKAVTLIYAGLALIQGVAAIWMVGIPGEQRLLVFLPFAVVYFLVGARILARARRAGLL
ncbi:MAG: UDP-phosphate alpha-N-acetylglucosaminyl 1-phosphate transferase [Deltaproteobacteria bacterium RIFCSPLOWO2_02_FULL_53_8]|nr:MAG: UDP-phosphate alpha-N-acetylglucosaminyl 1-phosphate transferase [Deltaproteobacteria bacterium RIFCSPLOWO2_02_FULL_53_8]